MSQQSVFAVLACLAGAASLELPQLSRRRALAVVVALPAPALAKIDYGDAAPKAESRGYPRLDVNNAVATEFTAFPGLYPTIAGKVCRNAPFSSKAALYEMLDADEKAKLKKFDKYIVVNARSSDVMQYKNAGLYFRGKGGDAKSSSSYRDEQIAQLQVERRANRY